MRSYVFFIFCFFWCLVASGQQKKIDSLHNVLRNHSSVNNYRPIIYQIYIEEQDLNVKERFIIDHKTIQIAESLPYKDALFMAYLHMGKLYHEHNDLPMAINYWHKAKSVTEKYNLELDKAKIYQQLGFIYQENYYRRDSVVYYYLKANELYKKQNQIDLLSTSLNGLATFYYQNDFLDKAIFTAKEAMETGQRSDAFRIAISACNTLGLIFFKKNDYLQSLKYFDKSIRLAQAKKDTIWVGLVCGNIGELYLSKKDFKRAIKYSTAELSLNKKYVEYKSYARSINILIDCYTQTNKLTQAKFFLDSCSKFVNRHNLIYNKPYLYKNLSQYYSAINDYKSALLAFKEYESLKASLDKQIYRNEVSNLQSLYEIEKKELKIALLSKDNKIKKGYIYRQWLITILITSILVGMSITVLILFRNNKNRKNLYQILYGQKEEILVQNDELAKQQDQLSQQALTLTEQNIKLQEAQKTIQLQNEELSLYSESLEKQVSQRTKELTNINKELSIQNYQLEQFAYIVAHNLRAPIASSLGLINLMEIEGLINDENNYYVKNIKKSTERLDEVLMDLMAVLDIRKGLNEKYEDVFLVDKTSKVLKMLEAQIKESGAQIQTDFTVGNKIHSVSAYIENILYNFVSNSIKYKYGNRDLLIKIFTIQRNEKLFLCVSDNGLGINLEKYKKDLFKLYKRFHNHVEGKGLGLYMVKTEVDALGGEIYVESKEYEGTTFFVSLK